MAERPDTRRMNQNSARIVVTGGAGFIGSHLVDRLLAETRADIAVFDNLSRGRLANLAHHQSGGRVRILEGDVRDLDAVADAIRGAAVVYHLAARSRVMADEEDVDRTFATNVVGTYNVLRAAANHAVGRLIFASSHEVYGDPAALPVDEGQPLLTISGYGASKAAGEAYCRAFRRLFGLDTVILRLTDVYGPRDFGRPIPIWLEEAAAGRELRVSDATEIVDLIWIDQAVEALIRAAALDRPVPPINVASGTGTRVIDVVRRIRRLTGGRGEIKLLPTRSIRRTHFVASVERMRQILLIEPALDPLAHLPKLLPAVAASVAVEA